MKDQFQCPHCGGFKVQTEIKKVDRSGKEYSKHGASIEVLWLIGIIMILVGIQLANLQILFLPIGILLFALCLFMYFRSVPKGSVNKYFNVCSLCGYKWNRSENEPNPPVTVRPDLIKKGEDEIERIQTAVVTYYAQPR